MKRILFTVLSIVFTILLNATTYAEHNSPREKFYRANINKTSSDFIKMAVPRAPARTPAVKQVTTDRLLAGRDDMPGSFWLPAEFNESQAALISWPSYAYDSLGRYLEPFMDGMGWGFDESSGHTYLATVEGYVLDLYQDSPYPEIWAKLADAIQRECTALIRISAPQDTAALIHYMDSLGAPLYNYKFICDPRGENGFWMRDFAPYGLYYGVNDSLALLDAGYYPGRPNDDLFSDYLGEVLGVKVFHTTLETEGGNFMTDGFGNVVMSNVVYEGNSDDIGFAGSRVTPMTQNEVREEIRRVFGAQNLNILQHLYCDGGTGHIDIYLKMTDEYTTLTSIYPDQYNNGNFQDYNIAKGNVEKLGMTSKAYGKPIRFNRIILPTNDAGGYNTSCDSYTFDARGYVNGLLINKTFIYPTYHNQNSGNALNDSVANEELKKFLPGYRLVPIDSRILTPMGGAIHCVTMQIPADNPIRVSHQPIVGEIKKAESVLFKVNAQNARGIDSVLIKYRAKGANEWTTAALSPAGAKGGYSVNLGDKDFKSDSVEYFVEAWAKGKREPRPFTAPEGYYSFSETLLSSVAEGPARARLTLSPNPGSGIVRGRAPFAGAGELILTDLQGRICLERTVEGSFEINCEALPEGVYFARLSGANIVAVAKLVIIK
ncbi:MAG: agmatine deiminase family protein [Chloroflexota bacterium]